MFKITQTTQKEKSLPISFYFKKEESEALENFAKKQNIKKSSLVRRYVRMILEDKIAPQRGNVSSDEKGNWVAITLTLKPSEIEKIIDKARENNAKRGNYVRVEVLKFLSADIEEKRNKSQSKESIKLIY